MADEDNQQGAAAQPTTEQLLRNRQNELQAKQDQIMTAAAPLRAERDRIKNEALAQAQALDDQIAQIETGLSDINSELGRLARALGGYSISTSDVVR